MMDNINIDITKKEVRQHLLSLNTTQLIRRSVMSKSIYAPKDISVFGWYPIEFEYPPGSELIIDGNCSGELNGFFGKTHTKEARKAIAEANRGRPVTAATRKAISEVKRGFVTRLADGRPVGVNNKGRKVRPTDLENVAKAHKARSTVVKIDDIVYNSISQAAKALGVSINPIRRMIRDGEAEVIQPSEV